MKYYVIWLAFIFAVFWAVATVFDFIEQKPKTVTLRFVGKVGEQPLELNQFRYSNPGGPGQFKLRDVQLFISNLSFISESRHYSVPDSYHLVRFMPGNNVFDIDLQLPAGFDASGFTMGVGVDPKANGTIYFSGDLDPNSRMAWSWDVGYKFVLLEGTLETEGEQQPLVYHVGFDENYARVDFNFDEALLDNPAPLLTFHLDFLRLFTSPSPMDLNKIPTVKFDRKDAKRIARGFSSMVSLCTESCESESE